MAVKVGHARISENGNTYGKKGDQTGTEVCVTNWVKPGFDFVAIHPDPAVRERHARNVERACANNNVGYAWPDRNTLYTELTKHNMDMSKVGPCNTDCSALQNAAAVAANTPNVTYGSNGWTTSTMRAAMKAAGYKILTGTAYLTEAYAVRGAIYVAEGNHTVCALGNGSKAAQTLQAAGLSAAAPSGSGNTAFCGKGIGEGTALQDMAVRTKADGNAAKIGVVSAGKKVEILADPTGWMKIVWPGADEGYAFTSNRNGKYYEVTLYRKNTGNIARCFKLNVRETPGGTIIGTLDAGAEVTIVDESGAWLQISAPKKGWIKAEFVDR